MFFGEGSLRAIEGKIVGPELVSTGNMVVFFTCFDSDR